jgi:hypothetical protein
MSALSIQPTYPIFTDIDGQPLDDGYIFIGVANLQPIGNPINVYWDAALTIPAAQPIRTISGYPANAGTPGRLYVNSDYSIQIQNKNGTLVYSAPVATERYSGNLISFTGFKGQVGTIADLADDDGSDWIGFEQAGANAVPRSVQDKLREVVSVKDFGAVADGVTDDTAAINAAFDYVIGNQGGTLYFPSGVYLCKNNIGNISYTQNNLVDLQIIAEPGAEFNFQPNSEIVYGFYLQFPRLRTLQIPNGLRILGNDLIRCGIWVSGDTTANSIRLVDIQNCYIQDIKVSAVTGSDGRGPVGISVSSTETTGGFSFVCNISNNTILNCTAVDLARSGQGIAIQDFATVSITNNYVTDVLVDDGVGSPRGTGISMFSRNINGRYTRSQATVSGNNVRNCGVYFVKLQTNGSCTVANNLFTIVGSGRLNTNFSGVDSQAGDATIENNTYLIGGSWSSPGTGQSLATLQAPTTANVVDSYEPFFQRFRNNNVYIEDKQWSIGVFAAAPADNVQCILNTEIVGNRVNSNQTLFTNFGAGGAYGISNFIYSNGYPSPTNTTGQWTLTVSDNTVYANRFFVFEGARDMVNYPDGNDPAWDYTDKWFVYCYDNSITGFGNDRNIIPFGDDRGGYTSTCMFRDNNLGPAQLVMNWPLDLQKLIDGCDFRSFTTVMYNVPAQYNNSRIVKKGGKWQVQRTEALYYISDDATTWTDIS